MLANGLAGYADLNGCGVREQSWLQNVLRRCLCAGARAGAPAMSSAYGAATARQAGSSADWKWASLIESRAQNTGKIAIELSPMLSQV